MGDLTLIGDKWGPSIGPAQIMSLRHPNQYPFPDTLRVASQLIDREYDAGRMPQQRAASTPGR